MAAAIAVVLLATVPAQGQPSCPFPGQVTVDGTWTSVQAPVFPDSGTVQRATAYALDPSVPSRLLVTNSTTVMQSLDGGCTWRPVFSVPTMPGAFDAVRQPGPREANAHYDARVTVLASPGASRAYLAMTITDTAGDHPSVARSTDGGATWSAASGLPLLGRSVALAAAPSAPTVYLAVSQGSTIVHASVDGGGSWAARGALPEGIAQLVVDEADAQTLWGWGPGGLVVSTDGATRFRRIPGMPRVDALDIQHAPGAPPSTTVFLPDGGVRVSVDAGETFRALQPPLRGATSAAHTGDHAGGLVATTKRGVFHRGPGNERWDDISPAGMTSVADVQATRTDPTIAYVLTDRGLARTALTGGVVHRGANRHLLPPGPPFLAPPPGEERIRPGESVTLRHTLYVPRRIGNLGPVDVWFLVDTTTSMHPLIEGLRAGMGQITRALAAGGVDARFGVAAFRDYPILDYGSPGDIPYERVRDLGPPGPELQAALDRLEVGGGGDPPEAQLTALFQTATGAGQRVEPVPITSTTLIELPEPIEAGQGASFRENAQKLVILGTDQRFHRSDLDPSYPGPSFRATADLLAGRGIRVAGLALRDAAVPDLRAMALATRTLAAEDIDCDGNGSPDVRASQPVVCRLTTEESAPLATAVLGALHSVEVVGRVTLSVHGPGDVVRRVTPAAFGPFSLRSDRVLPFQVTYACTREQAGQRFPVTLQARVGDLQIFAASAAVVCGQLPGVVAGVQGTPRAHPPEPRPQTNTQVQPTPQAQVQVQPMSQPQPAVQLHGIVAEQRQAEPQAATAPVLAWTAAALMTLTAAVAARRQPARARAIATWR